MPGARCTLKPRVRNKTKHTSVVTTVTPEITRRADLRTVGWVEPFAKPITVVSEHDGYRFAQPILRADFFSSLRGGSDEAIYPRHSRMVRYTRPQMCNCTSANLEIPGSML